MIQPQWDAAYGFSEGLARVVQNRNLGYIDKTGKIIAWDKSPKVILDDRVAASICRAVDNHSIKKIERNLRKIDRKLIDVWNSINCKKIGKNGPNPMHLVLINGYSHVTMGQRLCTFLEQESPYVENFGFIFNQRVMFLGKQRTVIDILDKQRSVSDDPNAVGGFNNLRKRLVEMGALTGAELDKISKSNKTVPQQ